MKKIYTIALALTLVVNVFAQDKEQTDKVVAQIAKDKKMDEVTGWKKGNIVNLSGAQTYLNQFWQAGGLSSIAINALYSGFRNYTKGKMLWENKLDLELGAVKLGFTNASTWTKANDRIDLTTEFGRQLKEKWYLSGLGNFRSQMLEGFDPTRVRISNSLAPAYLTAALGIKYKASDNFKVFFSPLAYRATLVTDKGLIRQSVLDNVDLFGVQTTQQKTLRNEVGALLIGTFVRKLMENITFKTDVTLYSNYLKDPQNVDIYWNALLDMQVNKYISVNLGTNLIYDHDILVPIVNDLNVRTGVGPRTQFKQFLNVGLKYQF